MVRNQLAPVGRCGWIKWSLRLSAEPDDRAHRARNRNAAPTEDNDSRGSVARNMRKSRIEYLSQVDRVVKVATTEKVFDYFAPELLLHEAIAGDLPDVARATPLLPADSEAKQQLHERRG